MLYFIYLHIPVALLWVKGTNRLSLLTFNYQHLKYNQITTLNSPQQERLKSYSAVSHL